MTNAKRKWSLLWILIVSFACSSVSAYSAEVISPLQQRNVSDPPLSNKQTPEKTQSDTRGTEDGWLIDPQVRHGKLHVPAGNSHVMRFNRAIRRVAVSDPKVADLVMVDDYEILINTKKKGTANLIIWDEQDGILIYNLTATGDPEPLKNALKSISPGNEIEVFPTQEGFVVKGEVDTVNQQNQIANTAKAFAQDSLSVVSVNKAKQILLEIRFVEVDRSTGFELGIDGHYIGEKVGFTFLGGGTGAALAGDGVTSGLVNVAKSTFGFPALGHSKSQTLFTGGFTDDSRRVNTFLKALEKKNKIKVIARPNLLVRDSEEASFLVGGEFPVPTVTQNTIDVQYRTFGTRLIYRPEIIDENRIRLKVDTEVSQLDFANGVTVNNFLIPALSSRRTTTVVELNSGHSLVIGGLLQQRRVETESGTPILRKIPLLGRLFESTKNEYADVELLVVINPRIIDQEKDTVQLDEVPSNEPLPTALAMETPPFEDKRALAIEKALAQHVSPAKSKETVVENRNIRHGLEWKRLDEKTTGAQPTVRSAEENEEKDERGSRRG